MSRLLRTIATATAAVTIVAGTARAQFMASPVPANATIFLAGLQWAWANPLPASSGYLDLSYQSTQGWRLPTAAELASAPTALDFMFAGANVPLNSTDPISGAYFSATNGNLTGAAACATPYFSSTFYHCDWTDGRGQTGDWAGTAGAASYADQLVVRSAETTTPEPASMLLLGSGLMGLAGFARRRREA